MYNVSLSGTQEGSRFKRNENLHKISFVKNYLLFKYNVLHTSDIGISDADGMPCTLLSFTSPQFKKQSSFGNFR